jgi:hypothetical protein
MVNDANDDDDRSEWVSADENDKRRIKLNASSGFAANAANVKLDCSKSADSLLSIDCTADDSSRRLVAILFRSLPFVESKEQDERA